MNRDAQNLLNLFFMTVRQFFKTACKNAFYFFFLIADEDKQGKRVDVGSILKKYIEEKL